MGLDEKMEQDLSFFSPVLSLVLSLAAAFSHFVSPNFHVLSSTVSFSVYLLAEDGADGPLHLGRVLDIHRPHVGFTDVHLRVRMLGGQLHRELEVRKNKRTFLKKSLIWSRRAMRDMRALFLSPLSAWVSP